MRKKMANDKVIKAMAVGLSAVISLSTPMTAMAAEGDVDNTPGPTDGCDTIKENNQVAESAIEDAKKSTSSTETTGNTVDIEEENQTKYTDGSSVTVTPDAAEAAQAEVLENVEAEVKKEDTTETVTYENVAENEQAAKESLVNAEVDLIQKDASEQAADVAVNKADGIVEEINTNIKEIEEVADGAAKEAVAEADAAAAEANSATTAAEVNEAIEKIEAAQAKLEEQQAEAQANYDENVEKLAVAEAELKAAEEALAAAEASLNASKEDIAKAQAAVDEAAKEAEALKKAVDDEADNLKNTQVALLKAAYDDMIAKGNLITKLYDGEASKGDGIGDEFVDSFGTEYANNPAETEEDKTTYWQAADKYFALYIKYVYGNAYESADWVRANNYYENEEYNPTRDNNYVVTLYVLDEDGNKILGEDGNFKTEEVWYTYHTDSSKKTGDICIYEKKDCYETDQEPVTESVPTLSHKIETKDENGNVVETTYVKYADVKTDNDVKVSLKDNEGNDTGSFLVKNDQSTITADVNDLENYKKTLKSNQEVTNTNEESAETTYSVGTVTVIDSYEQKSVLDQSYGNFNSKKDVEDTVSAALENGQKVKISWVIIPNVWSVDKEIDSINGFTMFLNEVADAFEKFTSGENLGINVETYKNVDDTTKPITHEEDGIIETTTADVTVKEVKTESKSDFDDTWGWVRYKGFKIWGITETSEEKATKAAQARVAQIKAANPNANASYELTKKWGVVVGYKIVYDTYTTSNQTVSTKSYTAVRYDINAINVTTTKYVTLDWLEERKNTENDATVMDAIANYEKELLALQNKQDAAAVALAAAQQAKKDVEAAANALASEDMNVDRTSYKAALDKYNSAVGVHKKSLDKLGDINDAVIKAQEDLEDAEEELAKFIPIPDDDEIVDDENKDDVTGDDTDDEIKDDITGDDTDDNQQEELGGSTNDTSNDDNDDDDDDDDFVGALPAAVTPVITNIAPAAVPLAAAPVVGGGAVVDGAEDDADDNEGVVIEDGETPLAGSIEDVVDSEEKIIEDEETPLAAAPVEKMSWWWLLVVALFGATGYEMYRKHQAKKAEADKEK